MTSEERLRYIVVVSDLYKSANKHDGECEELVQLLLQWHKEEMLKIVPEERPKGRTVAHTPEQLDFCNGGFNACRDEIINSIKTTWNVDISEEELSDFEKDTADQLYKNKYNTNAWNFQSIDNEGLLGACFVHFKDFNL